MLRAKDIQAALEAEAALAQVPAREILARVKRSGARVRKQAPRFGGLLQAVAVCATLGLIVSVPLLRGYFSTAKPVPAAPAVNPVAIVKENPPGPVTAYESKALNFRNNFPSVFRGPKMGEKGALIFTGDLAEVTVARRLQEQERELGILLGELVAENAKQSDRLLPMDSGLRNIGGRMGAYLRVAYVSAAAGFDRQTYVVPAGGYEYTVTCATKVGGRAAWALAEPVCRHITDTLELATDQGFISRAKAQEAALKAVPGEYEVFGSLLAEKFEGLGLIWRVELARKGEQRVAYAVVLDAKTGKIHYVENMETLERQWP